MAGPGDNGPLPTPEGADIDVDGRRWHYYTAGQEGDPTVVLVHGFRGSGRFFGPLMRTLAGSFYVVAPDLPGHGSSQGWEPDEPAVEQWELLDAFLDGLSLGPIALLGSSRGGAVSIQLAARRPGLVRAMVLVSSSGVPFRVGTLNIHRMVADASVLPPAMIVSLREAVAASRGYEEARGRAMREGLLETDLGGLLHLVRVPTLIVWGALDRTIPLEVAHALAEGIPGARLEIMEGVGHLPFIEQPRSFGTMVDEFIFKNICIR